MCVHFHLGYSTQLEHVVDGPNFLSATVSILSSIAEESNIYCIQD